MRALLLSLSLLPGLLPTIAHAHAILMSSDPLNGATVTPGSRDVTLRYNSRIDRDRSRLTLQGTNAQAVLPLKPDRRPDTLAAPVDLSPGTYVLHWQVLATDGHLTRGDIRFTVTPP